MKFSLTSIPLFSGLSSKQLDLLSKQIQNQKFIRNSIIIAEGEQSDSLYIVNEGNVKIFLSDAEGKEMQLRILGPGDYFGELALLDQKPRSASVMASSDCRLSVITSRSFLRCLEENPDIALVMLQVLAGRLRDATDLQRQLALMDVYGRLRMALLAEAKIEDGVELLRPKPTQQDIANKTGASREMISRLLSDLKAQGYIDITKTSITILKKLPEKL